MTPKRIYFNRFNGQKMPDKSKLVTRPSRWGNPAEIGEHYEPWGRVIGDNAEACKAYREHLAANPELAEAAKRELRGFNLACNCPEGEMNCHGQILLEISNSPPKDARAILNSQGREALQAAVLDFVPIAETEAEADPGEAPEAAEPAARFVYDGSRYYLDTAKEFVPMDQKSVSRHLKSYGYSPQDIEGAICRIQIENHIHFAGALAGHPRGIHTAGGSKLLATVSPEIIQPQAGQWPTIRAVLEGLLVDPDAGQTQVDTFLAWLKIARESLVSNRRRPGQAIAFAGRRGSGKSLLIDITEAALGGRRANPYAYFTGRTNFNADLAGAELLAVDDEAGSTDIRSRRTLAANIKACLFAGAVRIEGKNKTAFTFKPCWRMLIALNDEPEALLVLPPITEDIGDKITLFKCHKRPLPMPAFTLDEREAFFAQLMAELPALLAWLEAWKIPASLAEERCGVRAFHHPAILAALHELSPEGQLIGLIDTAHHDGSLPLPWIGTAAELKGILCHLVTTARDAEKLLGSWHAATGSYLARLEGQRVERLPMLNGNVRWKVYQVG
jgi:hypothetical protein